MSVFDVFYELKNRFVATRQERKKKYPPAQTSFCFWNMSSQGDAIDNKKVITLYRSLSDEHKSVLELMDGIAFRIASNPFASNGRVYDLRICVGGDMEIDVKGWVEKRATFYRTPFTKRFIFPKTPKNLPGWKVAQNNQRKNSKRWETEYKNTLAAKEETDECPDSVAGHD